MTAGIRAGGRRLPINGAGGPAAFPGIWKSLDGPDRNPPASAARKANAAAGAVPLAIIFWAARLALDRVL
jgi:hypothetical protein